MSDVRNSNASFDRDDQEEDSHNNTTTSTQQQHQQDQKAASVSFADELASASSTTNNNYHHDPNNNGSATTTNGDTLARKKKLEDLLRRASEELKTARTETAMLKEENEKLKTQVAEYHSAKQIQAGTSAVVKELQELRTRVRELLEKNLALDDELKESNRKYNELSQRYDEKQRALLAKNSASEGGSANANDSASNGEGLGYADRHSLKQQQQQSNGGGTAVTTGKAPLVRSPSPATQQRKPITTSSHATGAPLSPFSKRKQNQLLSGGDHHPHDSSAAAVNKVPLAPPPAVKVATTKRTPSSTNYGVNQAPRSPIKQQPLHSDRSTSSTAQLNGSIKPVGSSSRSATPNAKGPTTTTTAASAVTRRTPSASSASIRSSSVTSQQNNNANGISRSPLRKAPTSLAASSSSVNNTNRSLTPPPPQYTSASSLSSSNVTRRLNPPPPPPSTSSSTATKPPTTTTTTTSPPRRVSSASNKPKINSARKPISSLNNSTASNPEKSAFANVDVAAVRQADRNEAERAAATKHYNDVMLSRLRRAIAPAPTKQQIGEVVHAMVEELQKSLARHGASLQLKRKEPCVYWSGTKKLHLGVDSGKLVVTVGGGHTDLLEYMERHKLCTSNEETAATTS